MKIWTSLVLAVIWLPIPALGEDSGWIGISIEEQKDRGVMIHSVEPNSPAAKAGLKKGDVILQFNKEDVIGVRQLRRLLQETPVGRSVELKICRDNHDDTIYVTRRRHRTV